MIKKGIKGKKNSEKTHVRICGVMHAYG